MITHFYQRLSQYLKIYLLLLGLFLLFRVLFLCTYCDVAMLQQYKTDFLKTFWVGFRCDTVVLCFSLFPLFVLNLFGFLFFFKETLVSGYHRFLQVFSKVYYIILFILIFWVNVCDFFYYRTFHTHFDHRVFGIFEDGTKEVMTSVWSDYPVILVSLFFIVLLFGWLKIVNKLQSQTKPLIYPNKVGVFVATIMISSGLLFLGARSSFTTFPFQKNALAFSPYQRLNDAAANGVFMLNEAISDKMQNTLQLNPQSLLAGHGFTNLAEAKKDWDSGTMTDSCHFFAWKTTPDNPFLETEPPNIVLIIMEGWSSDFFNFHSEQCNMLGNLEQELPNLLFFPFCFPVNNGTISAMETFLTNNVGPALSMSQYANIQLNSSTAVAFKNKNYETSFYTGGYTGWRNIGKYFRTQGIENVRGAEFLKTIYPKTEEADWGVFDQYMFDALEQQLQNRERPQFLISMTITNHSPHKIPKYYQPYSIIVPDSLRSRITGDEKSTRNFLQTFQYANNCLGKFIHNLRHSPMGENTIVVITGDHSLPGGFTYKEQQFLYGWAVPLAFYIPEKYKQNISIDTHRLVSHKDILPTIYHLAFSNYPYRATGDNIFDATTANHTFLITNSSWVMGKAGVIHLDSQQSYGWGDSGYFLKYQDKTPELEAMRKRANAWMFGMKWQIFVCENHKKENFLPLQP